MDFLNDFRLVGGTGLALYLGHRLSIDIDLFTDKKTDLLYTEGKLNEIDSANFLTRTAIEDNRIRLASLDDIVTMKLGAIANRGAKKDFVDLFFILQHYNFDQLCTLYSTKCNTKDLFGLFRTITFFDDVETDDMQVVLIDKTLKWPTIKKEIQMHVKQYLG